MQLRSQPILSKRNFKILANEKFFNPIPTDVYF